MAIPKEVKRLVERFRENREAYLSSEYNETQLRREFLDPFFKSLGWDVDNEQGYAEAYKDVIHEDAIKIERGTKAPDYAFRIGGTRKFFVEAKRPSVGIKDNIDAAYQLRRYAWSAKLPLSILTDFEEFAVYDCRARPKQGDKASIARTFYFTYEEYEEKWDEIAGIFSPDAIRKGSFDKYVETKKMRGTAEVDDAFLLEIEGWRAALARNISLRNAGLSNREVNFAVQRTIDRIIFLRIGEDRGIEEYGQLMSLCNGANVYQRLCQVFRNADNRYNSGLFHFRKEKGRAEAPDDLTLALDIDDTVLKEILGSLYYPESPYEFSVLPADILGHIYEQFLGKVIRLTAGHRAVVEEKPEVRKAGGVYYTPTYIVDYIVEHTVGKLLEGKTPSQAAKLRVLDPACGSGSFLLGAYQRLLDWHLKRYAENQPEKHAKGSQPKLFRGPGGDWRLTTSEKKRILLNSIYGVDIDPQAVEVTKLSLLLKVLEGESDETLGKTLRMFHERALPDLGANIKCGNSLIGPDFYEGRQLNLIDAEERYRINAFDWHAEFPEIMKAGGFNAVIGNPPYGAALDQDIKAYLFRRHVVIRGQPESYEYFILRSLEVTKDHGRFSFIVPTNFVESDRADGLRRTLLTEGSFETLASFRYNVWRRSAAETLVMVYEKGAEPGRVLVTHPGSPAQFLSETPRSMIRQAAWQKTVGNRFVIRGDPAVLRSIERAEAHLGDLCDVSQGIIVYKTRKQSAQNPYISDSPKPGWKRLLDTKSRIDRYTLAWGGRYLNYGEWLWCPRDPRFFDSQKLLFVRLRNKGLQRRLVATYDDERLYNRDNFNNIVMKEVDYSIKYVLGLFNSTLTNYWYRLHFDNVNINPTQVRMIPVPVLDLSDAAARARHDRMVELVDTMLESNKDLPAAKTTHEESLIERLIEATDKQIDQLVYELYGLTDGEIRIVEEATKHT